MLIFQDGPAKGKANGLCIRSFIHGRTGLAVFGVQRAPLFLRVTCREGRGGTTATGKWDALDQLSDEAEPNETLYAYRKIKDEGWIHMRLNGSGTSGTFWRATYVFVDPQPDDATMRDFNRWRSWCTEQAAKKGD